MIINSRKIGLEKLNFNAFLLFAFSLNFPQPIIEYTLGFWVITSFFCIDYKQKPTIKKVYYIPLFLISFLILGRIIVSITHHDFPFLLIKLLDTQLSLLLLPILLIFQVNRYFNLKRVLFAYIIGSSISCIIAVTYFYLYRYNIFSGGSADGIPLGTNIHKLTDDIFIFQHFISPYFKHRAAMGVNLSLSIASLIYLIKTSEKLSFYKIIAAFLVVTFLSVVLYSTGSRSGIISLIFVFLFSTVYMFRRKRIVFITFLLIGALITGLSSLKTTRISADESKNSSQNDISRIDPRIQIWKSALKIIDKNVWLGVGYSNVKPALLQEYKERGLNQDLAGRFNSHNQFLQFALESGIWASIIFALILLPIYFARRIYFLSLSFSTVFTIYSMFEDTFIIINGVTVFVFFIALLVLAQKKMQITNNRNYIT